MMILVLLASGIVHAQSLSNLAPRPRSGDEDTPAALQTEQVLEAVRVSIDDIPMIRFTSKKGTIYLPNLNPDQISPKTLEQASCAQNSNGDVERTRTLMKAEKDVSSEFKGYFGVIFNTIQTKCANNSDRNTEFVSRSSVATLPAVEIGLQHNPKVKKPGDELKSNKAFVRPTTGTVGVGSSF